VIFEPEDGNGRLSRNFWRLLQGHVALRPRKSIRQVPVMLGLTLLRHTKQHRGRYPRAQRLRYAEQRVLCT
jgi:hypothetical protein